MSHIRSFLREEERTHCSSAASEEAVSFKDPRFGREEQGFDINHRDDEVLVFESSPRKESSSIQSWREQVEVDIQGAEKMVMVMVLV
ncbi:uncharacterized protein ARMOST_18789 [Armillaria ostoyae]|uniref:Uncharacterized protein n=1 Tax=Armillaria ostoyae TaxID=47428 RepID=A0A284S2T4_ARMOS|nr:uncharacterized protein ARMOST_18789 [Armillaria ostoyae]